MGKIMSFKYIRKDWAMGVSEMKYFYSITTGVFNKDDTANKHREKSIVLMLLLYKKIAALCRQLFNL